MPGIGEIGALGLGKGIAKIFGGLFGKKKKGKPRGGTEYYGAITTGHSKKHGKIAVYSTHVMHSKATGLPTHRYSVPHQKDYPVTGLTAEGFCVDSEHSDMQIYINGPFDGGVQANDEQIEQAAYLRALWDNLNPEQKTQFIKQHKKTLSVAAGIAAVLAFR